MEFLNSRELATAVWAILLISLSSLSSESRKTFKNLVVSFFQIKLIAFFLFIAAYTTAVVVALANLGLWDSSQIKGTLVWYLFVGIGLSFEVFSKDIDRAFVKDVLWKQLGFLAAIEYFIALYPYSFWVEFILVPLIYKLLKTQARGEYMEGKAKAGRNASIALGFIGIIAIIRTARGLISDAENLSFSQFGLDAFTPLALTIIYLPILYLMYVFANYERAHTSIGIALREKPVLAEYAKKQIYLTFHMDVNALNTWKCYLNREGFQFKSEDDIQQSFKTAKRMEKIKTSRVRCKDSEGWSAKEAVAFLEKEGLKISQLNPSANDRWTASSTAIKIGGKLMPDYVTYFLEGEQYIAKKLRLTVRVTEFSDQQKSHEDFFTIAQSLVIKALGDHVSLDINVSLQKESEWKTDVDGHTVSLKNEPGLGGSYFLTFTILAPDFIPEFS